MGRKVPLRCSVRLPRRLLRPFSDSFSRHFGESGKKKGRSLLRTLARGTTASRFLGIPSRSSILPRPDTCGPEERSANIYVVCELSVVCGQLF